MDLENIGAKIKKLRKRLNWSQEELARKADVPFTTVAKIENVVIKNPSIEKIAKIAKALNISIDKLVNKKHVKN